MLLVCFTNLGSTDVVLTVGIGHPPGKGLTDGSCMELPKLWIGCMLRWCAWKHCSHGAGFVQAFLFSIENMIMRTLNFRVCIMIKHAGGSLQ